MSFNGPNRMRDLGRRLFVLDEDGVARVDIATLESIESLRVRTGDEIEAIVGENCEVLRTVQLYRDLKTALFDLKTDLYFIWKKLNENAVCSESLESGVKIELKRRLVIIAENLLTLGYDLYSGESVEFFDLWDEKVAFVGELDEDIIKRIDAFRFAKRVMGFREKLIGIDEMAYVNFIHQLKAGTEELGFDMDDLVVEADAMDETELVDEWLRQILAYFENVNWDDEKNKIFFMGTFLPMLGEMSNAGMNIFTLIESRSQEGYFGACGSNECLSLINKMFLRVGAGYLFLNNSVCHEKPDREKEIGEILAQEFLRCFDRFLECDYQEGLERMFMYLDLDGYERVDKEVLELKYARYLHSKCLPALMMALKNDDVERFQVFLADLGKAGVPLLDGQFKEYFVANVFDAWLKNNKRKNFEAIADHHLCSYSGNFTRRFWVPNILVRCLLGRCKELKVLGVKKEDLDEEMRGRLREDFSGLLMFHDSCKLWKGRADEEADEFGVLSSFKERMSSSSGCFEEDMIKAWYTSDWQIFRSRFGELMDFYLDENTLPNENFIIIVDVMLSNGFYQWLGIFGEDFWIEYRRYLLKKRIEFEDEERDEPEWLNKHLEMLQERLDVIVEEL